MDKVLAIIIIFISMMVIMTAFLAMGAVPEIFRQGKQIDQALIQQHEDESRANQTEKINRETNKSINDLEERLYDFMNLSAKRSEKGQIERQLIINQLQNQTQQIYSLLQTADNRNFEVNTKNLKILTNLTEELKEIKSLHKEIKEQLIHDNRTINSTAKS